MAREERRTRLPTSSPPRPEAIELEADDPGQTGFPVARVAPPVGERRLSGAALLVIVLIGLAVLKPWAPPGEGTGSGPAAERPAPPATSGPAAAPIAGPSADTAADLAGPVCLGAGAWRIASLETWQDQEVRVWRAIEPIAEATGPLDPAIPTAPAVGTEIRALGWCAPAYGPGRPVGPSRIRTWIVIDGMARDLELRQVQPDDGTTYLGGLYVPIAPCPFDASCRPTATRDVPQPWTSGRIVFRYEDLGAGTVAWFGADAVLSDPVPGPP